MLAFLRFARSVMRSCLLLVADVNTDIEQVSSLVDFIRSLKEGTARPNRGNDGQWLSGIM